MFCLNDQQPVVWSLFKQNLWMICFQTIFKRKLRTIWAVRPNWRRVTLVPWNLNFRTWERWIERQSDVKHGVWGMLIPGWWWWSQNFHRPSIICCIYDASKHWGTTSQQFPLTFIRLNLTVQFFGFIFAVNSSTVSRLFTNVIKLMSMNLVPDREQLRKALPVSFCSSSFNKCVCIIDCFELFIEQQKILKARTSAYSQYKLHNTVKHLIGITPLGEIYFISRGWGGREADVHISGNSEFLRHLLEGLCCAKFKNFFYQMYKKTTDVHGSGKDKRSPINLKNLFTARHPIWRAKVYCVAPHLIAKSSVTVNSGVSVQEEANTILDAIDHKDKF